MQTLTLHTFMHPLTRFSLYFPDETFVNYKHYQAMRKTGCTSFFIKFKDNACLQQSFTESYMVWAQQFEMFSVVININRLVEKV